MQQSSKYLVCVDDSESSRTALHFACKQAGKRGDSVAMLHIMQPLDMQSLFGMHGKMVEEQKQAADMLTKSLSESAFQYSGITPQIQIREGRLGEEIINATLEDSSINMLVLAASPKSSGHGALIDWLSSKLGDRLLVPIMLVPGNLTDLQIEQLS